MREGYRGGMSDGNRARGRPPLADVAQLRSRALTILLARGYENVTMADLATEVGLSIRTLHRYFPAKADIVWGGLDGAIHAYRRALDGTSGHTPLLEALSEAMAAVFAEETESATFGPLRLRLIAVTREFESSRSETYRRWRQETIVFIGRRVGVEPEDLRVRAAGAAVQATVMEALTWWAARPDELTPAAAVTQALLGLGKLSILSR